MISLLHIMSKINIYNKVLPTILCNEIIKKFDNYDIESQTIHNIQMYEYKMPIQEQSWERVEKGLLKILLNCLLKTSNIENLTLDSFYIQKYVTNDKLFIDSYNTKLSRFNKLTFIIYLSEFKLAEVKIIKDKTVELKEINKGSLIIIPEDINYSYQHELHKGNNYIITGQLRSNNNNTIGRMVHNDYFNPSF